MLEELQRNKRRSALLIGGFIVVVVGMAASFSALFNWGPGGVVVAVVLSVVMTWGSYAAGDKVVLRMSRARAVTAADEPRLHNIVEGLAIAAGLPKPAIYVVDDAAPNAFATGRDPEHASIAVTTGLLERLNRIELEGVIAHELAHVKNRDTLVMAITATLVGVLVLLADFTMRGFFWGGSRSREDRGGPLAVVLLVGGLLAALLMPLMARVMRFAVSRRREFYADMQGVQLTRYPPGLISALEKLRADSTVVRAATHATNHMWIESPLPTREQGWRSKLNRLFDTHPPMEERIKVLREL